MSADRMDLLEGVDVHRYVRLTEGQAAELGMAVYDEWLAAARDGVHIASRDYVQLLRDGARWRTLCSALAAGALWTGAVVAGLALMFVLGLVSGWVA